MNIIGLRHSCPSLNRILSMKSRTPMKSRSRQIGKPNHQNSQSSESKRSNRANMDKTEYEKKDTSEGFDLSPIDYQEKRGEDGNLRKERYPQLEKPSFTHKLGSAVRSRWTLSRRRVIRQSDRSWRRASQRLLNADSSSGWNFLGSSV